MDDDERRLRTTALRNVESIQIARQRAERELVDAKDALQRRTEELQQQREWFEVTLASIGDAVITTDIERRVTFLNPVAETMTGWSTQEAHGQRLERVFHIISEDTREAVENPVARVLESKAIVGLANHTSLIARNGAEIPIEDSAAPIRDRLGNVVGTVMVFRDVTHRRRAERELRRSEQLLSEFFENAAVGLHWVGPDGIVLRVNQTELDLLGYTREEYVGRHIAEFHADVPVINDILERLSCGECLEAYEARLRCKDGSLKHVLISSNVLWENGKFVHTRCFTRDITAQKQAENALRDEIAVRERAEAALREADRRKDEFLATLAHELRNPLAPIRQAALIGRAPNATDAQKRWSNDVITRQVHHMSVLLDDLLDISRVTRGTLELRTEMTELSAVVEAAVETARPVIEAKKHRLTIDLPQESVLFAADPLRLAQVLSNLLTNAAKYTDSGGHISLRCAHTSDEITIAVRDTGVGMTQGAIANLFVMFSQVQNTRDRSEGGLGIGLALAKGLVDLHDGSIEAASGGLGEGSQFTVRLPRRIIGSTRLAGGKKRPDIPAVGRRVLIADDNRDAAESLALLLRLEGHDVTVTHTGRDALLTFESMLPEVAIFDIGMPGLNGYEVARRVRQHSLGRAVTLIAVTGWGQEADKARALAVGFNHHLTKPIEPEELNGLLRAVP
ncbi:MAG TPA: PAS domain S-box protein [Casimicrobiaceae bacterium]|nr:PAS domain S-box protein [Casimicrobiaceae bacterium]